MVAHVFKACFDQSTDLFFRRRYFADVAVCFLKLRQPRGIESALDPPVTEEPLNRVNDY